MRNVVHVVSKNKQQRARRRAMLLLLEITGARRGEVASISVAAIRQAAQMKRPMLEVATLKRRQETPPVRYIPVSNADMVAMLEYVEVYRNAVVRKKWRGADHGLVLVSSRSGAPLCDSTITAEVKLLAKAAGIKQNVCPHMFRHRYITKLFVEMISRHQIENADEFRRALLSTESLKQRMLEWTGHTSILSLNTYISLAFDELSSYRKTLSHVQAGTAVESFLRVLKDEIQALRIGGGGKRVEPERLLRLAEALQYDLEAAFDEPD
jgi:integrase